MNIRAFYGIYIEVPDEMNNVAKANYIKEKFRKFISNSSLQFLKYREIRNGVEGPTYDIEQLELDRF